MGTGLPTGAARYGSQHPSRRSAKSPRTAGRAGRERGLHSAIDAYHGYEYKILTGQGKDAPGGAYDYLVKGEMIGGFARVAYPAGWNASGVMTVMCNHEGVVDEKNLGRNTRIIASTMLRFNPKLAESATVGGAGARMPAVQKDPCRGACPMR
jgi:Protein of unknown function (DUF2950)